MEFDNNNTRPPSRSSVIALLFVVFAACCCQLLIGYNQGVIAGALLFINVEFDLDSDPGLEGLITSIALYGSAVGICFSLSFLGRRIPLLIASGMFAGAGALMFWSPTPEVLLVGRFFVGLSTGITLVNVPLFASECAPASIRGYLVSLSYTFLVFGVLGAYIVNFILTATGSTDWRLMLGIVVIPSVITFLLLLFLPESPRFLVRKMRYKDARSVLIRLRGTIDVNEIESEFRTIVRGVFPQTLFLEVESVPMFLIDGQEPPHAQSNQSVQSNSINEFSDESPLIKSSVPLWTEKDNNHGYIDDQAKAKENQPWWTPIQSLLGEHSARRALILCIVLEFFQQFSGTQAVTTYTPTILKDSGIPDLFAPLGLPEDASALLATILVYVTQLVPMFAGSQLIDKLGRRLILLITIPLMIVALCGIAASYMLPAGTNAGAFVALASIILFKCGYSPGLGPIPPVVESEIFPSSVRAFGLTVTSVFGAVFNIIILQTFPAMEDAVGLPITFFIFAGLSLGAELFVFFFIPETKLTQLEDTYHVLDNQK